MSHNYLASDMACTLTRSLRLSVRLASHIPPPKICGGSGRNLFIAMTQKTGCVYREENLVTVSPCGFPLNCSSLFRGRGRRASRALILCTPKVCACSNTLKSCLKWAWRVCACREGLREGPSCEPLPCLVITWLRIWLARSHDHFV